MSDYICEELMVEIFTRLPPKSLLRFRSLSKSLFSCISSPGFIRMHTFRSPPKIGFKHINRDKNKETIAFYTSHGEDELPFYCGYMSTKPLPFPCSEHFRIVGLCNGTFCMRIGTCLTLWNPSIRRKLRVPECPRSSQLPREGVGFGFDPISDDYKIVWMSCAKDTSFLYAVKTGTWCEIDSPKPHFTHVFLDAFLVNGVLHWEIDLELPEKFFSYIMTFDLSTHVFGTIPLPGPTRRWMSTGITTIQDSLGLISYGMGPRDSWIWVWRDASWNVVFKLGTGERRIEAALELQPTNNGDLLLNSYADGLHVFNPRTGARSIVDHFIVASDTVNFHRGVETLHLLDMGETSETTQL